MRDDGTITSDNYTVSDMIVAPDLVRSCGRKHEHTIKDFLSRPVILSQGKWDQTSVIGTELWSANFPSELLKAAYPQNREKVRGFVGIRAKVKITVQVNSDPAQSGIAVLSFFPFAEYIPQHANWFYKSLPQSAPTKADMVAVTSLSHTLINLANQTGTEMEIPYVSPYIYVNLVTGQGTFGKIALHSLVEIASGGSTTVNYTVWGSLTDVELEWPTDAPITTKWAQIGTELEDMERKGTISGIVGRAGGVIADVLPHVGLGWLSKPVSLFSTAASNVLKLFGFSKPTIQAPVTRVLQAPARNFLNCDGSDTSHVLGMSAGNELQTMTGFAGTDEDEMQLAYIAARSTYFDTFEWHDTAVSDTGIAQFDLTPYALSILSSTTGFAKGYVDRLTPAARMSTLFSMWRGDLVFTFHVAKTQMHSGRLRVSNRLYNYTELPTDLIDNPGFTETEDLDMATCSSFRVRIPFTSVRPWLLTNYDRFAATGSDLWNSSMGLLSISVLNPLVGPALVSKTVKITVFGHMENAQFAAPTNTTVLPYGLPTSVTTLGLNSRNTIPAETIATKGDFIYVPVEKEKALRSAQMGLVEKIKPGSETTAHRPTMLIAPQSMCTGEVVTSLRQYLKRFSLMRTISPRPRAATLTANGASGTCITIRPWAPNVVATAAPSLTAPAYEQTDIYSSIMPMFAFSRGGIRMKIVIDAKGSGFLSDIPMMVYVNMNLSAKIAAQPTGLLSATQPCFVTDDVPKTTPGNIAYQPGFAEVRMPIFFNYEGVAEFQVPYISTGHMTGTRYGSTIIEDRRSSKTPIPLVTISHPSFVTSTLSIYRAVADDFSFGGYLGSPQVINMQYADNPTV